MFLYLINLTINKYTSYIIVLKCWNTAARKHPTERENGPHWKKKKKKQQKLKVTGLDILNELSNTIISLS